MTDRGDQGEGPNGKPEARIPASEFPVNLWEATRLRQPDSPPNPGTPMTALPRRVSTPAVLASAFFLTAPAAIGAPGSDLSAAPEAVRIHPAAEWLAATATEPIKLWVFFTDKGLAPAARGPALAQARHTLSERSLDRRARRSRGLEALVGERDLPVHDAYVTQLLNTGATLRRHSRWLNAVSVSVPGDRLAAIAALPFVREVRPVVQRFVPIGPEKRESAMRGQVFMAPTSPPSDDALDYGDSRAQLDQIDLASLHDDGFSGAGVTVAMFDTGFRKSHDSLSDRPLVAEYDFVFDDGDTEDEPEDEPGAEFHGTACWSIVGGWDPGKLIGGAYGADFILAKTEDIRFERRVEEDHWVAAMEWAEGLGADVVSSSLGYLDFDDGFFYRPWELDGRTGVTTLAALEAARLGVVVCTAMGNSGPDSRTLSTPADADSILSIGAVYPSGTIAEFSSRGPTADERIKPEVCARGTDVIAADSGRRNRYYDEFAGTSAATPFVAAAAAVLLEIHPDWTPQDVIAAMRLTATRADRPGNDYGWGILQAAAAAQVNLEPLAVQFAARESDPVFIGDPISVDYILENAGGDSESVVAWVELENDVGEPYESNPIVGPIPVELSPGAEMSGAASVRLPGDYGVGGHRLCLSLGEVGSEARARDCFAFVSTSPLELSFLSPEPQAEPGGTLPVDYDITSQGSGKATFDLWVENFDPGGAPDPRNPVYGPTEISLGDGGSLSGSSSYSVPSGEPEGGPYRLCLNVGEYPDAPWGTACIEYEVLP